MYKTTKKEAIKKLEQHADEYREKGNVAGVAQCLAQINVIKSHSRQADFITT